MATCFLYEVPGIEKHAYGVTFDLIVYFHMLI